MRREKERERERCVQRVKENFFLRPDTESVKVKEASSKPTRFSNCPYQKAEEKERELGSQCTRHRKCYAGKYLTTSFLLGG